MGWTWNWPENVNGNILAYPEIVYGWKPWNAQSTVASLPKRISELSSLDIFYDVDLQATGRYNLAFDIWITAANPPTPSNISRELMIWEDNQGVTPAGTLQDTVSIAGETYTFYKGRMDTHDYLAFVKLTPSHTGKVPLAEFIHYLVQHGHITQDEFVSSIEFGNEIAQGSGELKLNYYVISAQ